MKNEKNEFTAGIFLLLAFVVWTVLIQTVDVQPVGVNGTTIGLASINTWFHKLTGVHMLVYTITDWLGLVPIFICLLFGILGLVQLIKRRSLWVLRSPANIWVPPCCHPLFWDVNQRKGGKRNKLSQTCKHKLAETVFNSISYS